jgi:hypothetical protein
MSGTPSPNSCQRMREMKVCVSISGVTEMRRERKVGK